MFNHVENYLREAVKSQETIQMKKRMHQLSIPHENKSCLRKEIGNITCYTTWLIREQYLLSHNNANINIGLAYNYAITWGFPDSSDGKESACNARGPRFHSLVQEDPLEKGMATYSNILTEEPGRIQSMGSKASDMTERQILC